jgi:hypothetical protein
MKPLSLSLAVLAALVAGALVVSGQGPIRIPAVAGVPPVTVLPASGVNGGGAVTTTQLLVPQGTPCGTPGLGFVGNTLSGIANDSGSGWIVCVNTTKPIHFSGSNLRMGSDEILGWTASAGNGTAAADTTIVRAATAELTYTTLAFAALGTPANGTQAFCTDCAPTTPASCPGTKASCVCTNGGVGSLAIRVNATWYCPF